MRVPRPVYGMHWWFNGDEDPKIEWLPYAYVDSHKKDSFIPIRELIPNNKYLNGSYYWSKNGQTIRLKK